MIIGNKVQLIKGYLPIDHSGKGIYWVGPADNEEFIGWPWGYAETGAPPFIQVLRDGQLVASINALDCAEISFINEEVVEEL